MVLREGDDPEAVRTRDVDGLEDLCGLARVRDGKDDVARLHDGGDHAHGVVVARGDAVHADAQEFEIGVLRDDA